MSPKGNLSILEALENLNTLVDADTLDEIEVTDEARFIPHKEEVEERPKEIYWVRAGPDDQTESAIKATLRSVYSYLQVFYHQMKRSGETKKLVEGVNTIMVLVGEAAKKLDRLGSLFKERVSDFPEYQDLQNFYQKTVIPESFHEFVKQPIAREVLPEQEEWEKEVQELLKEEENVEEMGGVHILNDIDIIRKDHLYELFYLKNEAGHPFYSYDLARNIKLACDFGVFAEEYFSDDPLIQIKNWEDKQCHLLANAILKKIGPRLDKFYKQAMKYKGMEGIMLLHNACMALMFAANPKNLIRQFSLKGCHLYFSNFLGFLREVLHNREYEKLVIYGIPSGHPFFQHYVDLVHVLSYTLFTETLDQKEVSGAIQDLIKRMEHHKGKRLSDVLMHANHALTEGFKKHPNGPVFKALDIVREEEELQFDPLLQGNLPSIEWALIQQGQEVNFLHLACPIVQEWINHADVTEEFKTFLHECKQQEHLLLINFQDRTSWKEHARCLAVEEIAKHAEFAPHLTVVTLAKDTDFYNQTGVYADVNDAKDFISQLSDHLGDDVAGYYTPLKVKKHLFPQFIEQLLAKIHETFFDKRTSLSYLERLDFIELTYLFVELKLIELIKPHMLALSSKDALDIGGTSSIALLALLTIAKGKKLDTQAVITCLFGPTLMLRERVIHPERFDRLVALVRLFEEKGDYLSPFASLFDQASLDWEIKSKIS